MGMKLLIYHIPIDHGGKTKTNMMDVIIPKVCTPSSVLSTIQSQSSPNKGDWKRSHEDT